MSAKSKIKFKDDCRLRAEIEKLYENASQEILANWSVSLAKHILTILDIDYSGIHEIADGFFINELWQTGNAGMHEVRQAGFKIHKIARECDHEIHKIAIRAAGHAVASGHMKEHSMVASDYSVKAIGLATSNDTDAIEAERTWQLNELNMVLNQDSK